MMGKNESKRRSGQVGEIESITDSVDTNLSKLQEMVDDRGA